jgi:hypothetical protein
VNWAGNPEAHDLWHSVSRNANVARLQIAVDEAVLMGKMHTTTHLGKEL